MSDALVVLQGWNVQHHHDGIAIQGVDAFLCTGTHHYSSQTVVASAWCGVFLVTQAFWVLHQLQECTGVTLYTSVFCLLPVRWLQGFAPALIGCQQDNVDTSEANAIIPCSAPGPYTSLHCTGGDTCVCPDAFFNKLLVVSLLSEHRR